MPETASWGWGRLKLKGGNVVQVSHVGKGNLATAPVHVVTGARVFMGHGHLHSQAKHPVLPVFFDESVELWYRSLSWWMILQVEMLVLSPMTDPSENVHGRQPFLATGNRHYFLLLCLLTSSLISGHGAIFERHHFYLFVNLFMICSALRLRSDLQELYQCYSLSCLTFVMQCVTHYRYFESWVWMNIMVGRSQMFII